MLALGLQLKGQTNAPGTAAQAVTGAVTTAAPATSPAPHVESIVSMRDKPGASAAAAPAQKQSYDFTVKDDQWLDTGVALAAGEQANFTATGSFTLSAGEWLVRMGWTGMEGPATAVSAELG